jgi:hypothetical protein
VWIEIREHSLPSSFGLVVCCFRLTVRMQRVLGIRRLVFSHLAPPLVASLLLSRAFTTGVCASNSGVNQDFDQVLALMCVRGYVCVVYMVYVVCVLRQAGECVGGGLVDCVWSAKYSALHTHNKDILICGDLCPRVNFTM